MTFPSSGLLATTQNLINTTVAQAATAVLNPSFGTTGTPQINNGNNAYPLGYGAASISLSNPGTLPVTNSYKVAGANALSSGSNTVYGIAQYGSTQGNAQNQCGGTISEAIPGVFSQIYQQLLTMANYSYRL